MQINNNIEAMVSAQTQIADKVSKIADVANVVGDPALQEVSQDLIDAIAGQIPEIISYQANAEGIKTQDAVTDILLNIKA
jgi:O6-methylguanine-DNA--protein-cysteine methyltransferase